MVPPFKAKWSISRASKYKGCFINIYKKMFEHSAVFKDLHTFHCLLIKIDFDLRIITCLWHSLKGERKPLNNLKRESQIVISTESPSISRVFRPLLPIVPCLVRGLYSGDETHHQRDDLGLCGKASQYDHYDSMLDSTF